MIYLDNSATTEISLAAKQKMIDAMDIYGNPSSTHKMGIDAHELLENARQQVAAALGLPHITRENLIFTSCGSEANNLAVLGSAYAKEKRRANKIITTDSEHPSIENVMKKLESDGFEIVRVSTRGGVVDEKEFTSIIDDKTLLVSLMMVNNETGALYDVKKLFSIAKALCPNVITHCDAIQGFLKVPFTPKSIGADLVSVSAHKIHGPKGVGALYVSPEIIKAKKIVPYIIGGGQESGLRSGTENIVGIAGFGQAAFVGRESFTANTEKMRRLREVCEQGVIAAGARVNIPARSRAPHILSVTLPNIKSETMLNFLSGNGICVSAGSACSAHAKNMSPTLLNFGLSPKDVDCTIRVSFSELNTEQEVAEFCSVLKCGIDTLVRIKNA